MADPSPFAKSSDGVRVRLRLTPKGKANKIMGLKPDADGEVWLTAQVTAVPEGGKANGALIKMLAKEWRLAKSAIEIIQGATDRNKTLLVSGDQENVMGALKTWADKLKI